MVSPRVYHALSIASERIGHNQYLSQKAAHVKSGRSPKTFRYDPTPEHRAIVSAMGNRGISDEEAMTLLHDHDTFKQRFPD